MKTVLNCLLAITAATASAYGASITWTLQNVTFNDGGTLTGTFTVDPDLSIGEVQAIDITASGGTSGYDFTWTFAGGAAYPNVNFGPDQLFASNPDPNTGQNYQLVIDFEIPGQPNSGSVLTDAGGTVPVVPGFLEQNGGNISFEFTEPGLNNGMTRYITGGSVTAPTSENPEPSTFGMIMIACAGGCVVVCKRNQQSRYFLR